MFSNITRYMPISQITERGLSMPKGKCRKCGAVYYGWALVYRKEENICPLCGGVVEVLVEAAKLEAA